MQLSLFSGIFTDHLPDSRVPNEDWSFLKEYLPPLAFERVEYLLNTDPVQILIARNRISKSGDFRASHRGNPARITVNGNLNPYAFLITLIHELAHHAVWSDHMSNSRRFSLRRRSRPLPHGKEWKARFRNMMRPFLATGVFPVDLFQVLTSFLDNPRASSAVDHRLSVALRIYDPPDHTIRLDDLPYDSLFILHGKRMFRKKEKLRTRYRCVCLSTDRVYLVNAGARVTAL